MKGSLTSLCSFALFALSLLVIGCATPAPKPGTIPLPEDAITDKPAENLVERHTALANKFERREQYVEAIKHWNIVSSLKPFDRSASEKVKYLKELTGKNAESHLNIAKEFLSKEDIKSAQRELLVSLAYDPYNREALEHIAKITQGELFSEYKAVKGDDLKKVAKVNYGDGELYYLIAYFNDIDKAAELKPGTVLRLPKLEKMEVAKVAPEEIKKPEKIEKEKPKQEVETKAGGVDKLMYTAMDAFNDGRFDDAMQASNRILQIQPNNADAQDMIAQINAEQILVKARNSFKSGNYKDAVELTASLLKTDKNNGGALDLQDEMGKKAEEHYRNGVNYFINEELELAVKEWQSTITLNSEHEKAKKDIDNARGLQEKLKKIK